MFLLFLQFPHHIYLYYEEKQKFEEKTEGVINRYVAKINDEIHQEYIHAVRQEYSSR